MENAMMSDTKKINAGDLKDFVLVFVRERLAYLNSQYGKHKMLEAIVFETSGSGYVLARSIGCEAKRYRFEILYNGVGSKCAMTVKLHGHCSSF